MTRPVELARRPVSHQGNVTTHQEININRAPVIPCGYALKQKVIPNPQRSEVTEGPLLPVSS